MNAPIRLPQEFRISPKDEAVFSTSKLCPISHNYQHHPLMQLDRLELLAKSLVATNQCRFINQRIVESSAFNHKSKSPDGRSAEQVFQQIETPGSWIALYDVQTDPEYQRFLTDVMATVRHLFEPEEKIRDIRGFIFISAPPSVTPFHIDRENNFWLQIKGRKTIHLWDRMDQEVVTARDVEDFIAYRSLDNVRLKEEFRQRSFEFRCSAGDGVYFPSTTPHMTNSEASPGNPGNEVAISIGINFYTNVTRHNAYVHTANAVLRRLGFNPQAPGHIAGLDGLKYPLGRTIVAWRKLIRGYAPPPGF
jgi:hypothetical protein